MRFAQLQGNPDVIRALVGMVDSGRVPHAILMELLTDEGAGTMVVGEEQDD